MKGEFSQSRGRLADRLLVLWALLAFASSALAASGDLHVRHLGIVQGLAQGSGAAIAQDADGFLWLGTQSGLQRYDGYDFAYYHHEPGRPGSLSQDDVRAVVVGAGGSIWVATGHGGLDRLKPDREGFEHFLHRADDPASIASDQLNALLRDRDGRLWIAGNDGVDLLEAGGRFRHFGVGNSHAADQRSYALAQDSHGRLWVGTGKGLSYIDQAGDALTPFVAAPGSDPVAAKALANATVNCIVQGHDGRLWIGTANGLFVLSADLRVVQWLRHADDDPGSLASNHVRAILEDANGTVWIGTYGGGLDRLEPTMRGWKIIHERHQPDFPDGLSSNYVLSLFTDAGGLVWIGTDGGGFDIYNPRSRAFGAIRHQRDDPLSIADDIVWAIEGDAAGNLWVGTQSGLTYLDKHHADSRQFTFDGSHGRGDDAQPAFTLYHDAHGVLWVGTGDGLFRNRGGTTPFVRVPLAPPAGKGSVLRVTQILGAPDDRLWLATGSALLLIDTGDGTVVKHYAPGPGAQALPALVTAMCETGDGALWVGTELGLRRFDPQRGGYALPRSQSAHPGVLATSDVLSCLAVPDGDLWVGTTSGLVRLRPATGYEHTYGMADGLPSATIYALLRDASGELWASTGRGLVRIDPDTGQMRSFDRTDGLANEEFNQLASFDRDGVLYFGGVHGVTMVYPAHLEAGQTKSRVGITRYTISGRDQEMTFRAPARGQLQVRYWQNALTFDVAMFDYAAPLENRFRYRLDGFDSTWHDLKDRHNLTYTNLAPGDYTLRVKGLDANGRPSANVATVAFEVGTPPWLRPWAWLLYVGCGLLVAAFGLHVFAVWIRRRRDLASEQQRRRLAESLHDVVHAISRLDDERAIAFELMQRLPDLIPHQHAACWSGGGGAALELVTMRGFAGASTDALRGWAQAHAALIGDLCRDGRARRLDSVDAAVIGVPVGASFMAIPLNATDDVCRLLLVGRNDRAFRQDELDLAAVLERQVSVVLDKARLIHQLETLARTDSLTGADNRRWFLQQADAVFDRCMRERQTLSLLLLDVDHFKRVNDTHGHAAGDAVLVELVARCRGALRAEDVFGRYGGEEFAVCLPGTTLANALAMAERLREAIGAAGIDTSEGVMRVTASFGVASCMPAPGDSLRAMIAGADKSLYAAKREGRDCVRGPLQATAQPG